VRDGKWVKTMIEKLACLSAHRVFAECGQQPPGKRFLFAKTVLLCVVAAILLSACTTTSEVKSMSETDDANYIPLDEEKWAIEQADLYHRETRQKGLLYSGEHITSYLGQIENRLLAARPSIQEAISLFILKSPNPNAFAFPNGNIYLHAGLFTTLESEDQLAAVAAHEIVHVTERHSVKAVIANKNKLIGSHIADIATGGFGLVYFGTYASIMNYSREQESDADRLGMKLLAGSGYQQRAMAEAYESLIRYPELRHQKSSIYSSHPSFQARIRDLHELAGEVSPGQNLPEIRDGTFRELKAKMMEDSLKIRLRNREFNLSVTILDEAAEYFGNSAKIDFYRGEIHHGFYTYPEIAAREYHFIETGKDKADTASIQKFEEEKEGNLAAAIAHYQRASEGMPPYPKSLRRLGEIEEQRGNAKQARDYFSRYLELQPDASDRSYVEHAMKRLGHNTGEGK
jgi:Zn-dependent protease with chaperone function